MKLHSNMRTRPKAMALSIQASLAMGLTLGAAVAPHPAEAQARMIEEIVVTARKREESLQETPIAITAFSGDRLREAGITNLADFNRIVPNVDVQAGSGNAGVANIYIRGVGQRNTEPNLDSGVGIYLDGVYMGRADGALLDVNDLASVEVLRGPQGTLFGKNTTGGALVFTTNRPGPEFEASVLGRVGNYNRRDAELMVNIPLVDDLLYTRLSMVAKKRDGYVENIVDGKDYNDEDRMSAVWQVRWLAHDDVTVDFNANYGVTRQLPRLEKCIPVTKYDNTPALNLDEIGDPIYWSWQRNLQNAFVQNDINSDGRSILEHCRDSLELDKYEAMSDLGGEYRATNKGLSVTVDWDVNDTINVKSITGWRFTKAAQDDDIDGIGLNLLHRTMSQHPFGRPRETNQYSQELQLTGDLFNGAVNYTTGAFLFVEQTGRSRTVNMLGPLQQSPTSYFYPTTATELNVNNWSRSAFVQADWHMSESWRLTAGLRYTWERRNLRQIGFLPDEDTISLNDSLFNITQDGSTYNFTLPNDFNPNHGFVEDTRYRDSVRAEAWTPMVSLQYFLPQIGPIDDGSIYLTYSEGFRSGGLSEATGGELERFKPEEVKNYELGVKIDAFGGRLRMNTAIFHMDYTDRQLTTVKFDPNSGLPAGATVNAAKSSISGIEIETLVMPIDGLVLGLNATWNRGKIKEFEDVQLSRAFPNFGGTYIIRGGEIIPAAGNDSCSIINILGLVPTSQCTIDRSDEDLPRLPKRSFMASAQYEIMTPVGMIVPRIQASWKFDQENCFDRTSCESGIWFTKKQYDLSARVTWMSYDERWMAAIFGTNLTKEDHSIGGTALADAMAYGGQAYAVPRMYGAELQYRWH